MSGKKKHTTARPSPALSETNYRAQSDVHALKAAAEIKADPKRHAAAQHHARQELHHLRKVAGRVTAPKK